MTIQTKIRSKFRWSIFFKIWVIFFEDELNNEICNDVEMRVVLCLLIICALSAGLTLDLEYEKPTVLITLLVRNKAHIYPKSQTANWFLEFQLKKILS